MLDRKRTHQRIFRGGDPEQAQVSLETAVNWCERPDAAPELARLARSLRRGTVKIITAVVTRADGGGNDLVNTDN